MTNYPKDEESSFKNEKNMSIPFFEEILEFTNRVKNIRILLFTANCMVRTIDEYEAIT